jgi:hypothetical protein
MAQASYHPASFVDLIMGHEYWTEHTIDPFPELDCSPHSFIRCPDPGIAGNDLRIKFCAII